MKSEEVQGLKNIGKFMNKKSKYSVHISDVSLVLKRFRVTVRSSFKKIIRTKEPS
jgi:hypothetical protein